LDLAKHCCAPILITQQIGKKTSDSNGFAAQHSKQDRAA